MQWSSINWPRLMKLAVLGALAFWVPDVILHALRGYNFNGHDVLVVTVVSPVALLIAVLLAKWAVRRTPQKRVVPEMLAGVWFFGGLFMMIGAGFHTAFPLVITLLVSILPVYTFMMATYDGALGALLLVPAAALAVWLVERSGILLRLRAKAKIYKPL